MSDKHEKKGIAKTAVAQIDDIVNSGAQSVIDVGSGPGSVMLSLLEGGINKVTGVDLSPKMIDVARSRLDDSEFSEDRYELLNQNFLDLPQVDIDAVSLHCVLCCHPDRREIIKKSISHTPQIITLTIPRPWMVFRLGLTIFGFFAKRMNKFYPFAHSQKEIDQQLKESGYVLNSRKKGLIVIQSSYLLTENSDR